jgi:hypothetical protein
MRGPSAPGGGGAAPHNIPITPSNKIFPNYLPELYSHKIIINTHNPFQQIIPQLYSHKNIIDIHNPFQQNLPTTPSNKIFPNYIPIKI